MVIASCLIFFGKWWPHLLFYFNEMCAQVGQSVRCQNVYGTYLPIFLFHFMHAEEKNRLVPVAKEIDLIDPFHG